MHEKKKLLRRKMNRYLYCFELFNLNTITKAIGSKPMNKFSKCSSVNKFINLGDSCNHPNLLKI